MSNDVVKLKLKRPPYPQTPTYKQRNDRTGKEPKKKGPRVGKEAQPKEKGARSKDQDRK